MHFFSLIHVMLIWASWLTSGSANDKLIHPVFEHQELEHLIKRNNEWPLHAPDHRLLIASLYEELNRRVIQDMRAKVWPQF